MADFPTLTVACNYPIGEQRENSVLKSEFEGGYVQTRARYTRVRRRFTIAYSQLSNADKTLIDNFIDTVNGGADYFNWTHPQSSTVYVVRFQSPPNFNYTSYGRWSCNFILEQV